MTVDRTRHSTSIPRGNTELMVDDHVLLISTDEQALW